MPTGILYMGLGGVLKLGGEDSEEQKKWEAECPLSKKQRLYGFAGCIGFGFLILILAYLSLFPIPNPRRFALLFTLSNLVTIAATGFLIGFRRQAKCAFKERRRIYTAAFIVSTTVTLIICTTVKNVAIAMVLSLLFCVVQLIAFLYYTLSYLPFGTQMMDAMMRSCFQKIAGKR